MHGTPWVPQENVFVGPLARCEPSSAFFENSKNLASSSCGLRPIDTGKVVEKRGRMETRTAGLYNTNSSLCQGSFRPGTLYIVLEELILGIVGWQIRGIRPRTCFSTNSQTRQTSSVGRPNFKTEVCSNSGFHTIAMLWMKEVEVAKPVDNLVTSQSIEGRDFPDFEMLDAKIAPALKRIIFNQHFRRGVGVEEQRAQKYDIFLRWREIA